MNNVGTIVERLATCALELSLPDSTHLSNERTDVILALKLVNIKRIREYQR